MAEIEVNLVAVERELWSGKAQMVVARTVDGDIGVMAGHSPLLAQLREGFAARIIETEDAQLSDEIDVTKARAAYEAAKSRGGDSAEAENELRRAQAQLLATGNDI